MNKLLIVFLAVALVSVHAFVKRDAPKAGEVNYLDEIKKNFDELTKQLDAKMKEAFDPEKIKKDFSELVDNISKTANAGKAA